jgi:SAM-dependent methyltransferase
MGSDETKRMKESTVLRNWALRVYRRVKSRRQSVNFFPGSQTYWERRYQQGCNSGVGSYGKFAEFKAKVLNDFVAQHAVRTVIEFGCGDGNQLSLANYPCYIGFDVSQTAIDLCRRRFASDRTKSFQHLNDYAGEKADLTLSLDVIYHLVEDTVFDSYMRTLFNASERHVAIYSSNSNDNTGTKETHIQHRKFTDWVEQNLADWKLMCRIPNEHPYRGDYKTGSWSDLFVYENAQKYETEGLTALAQET